IAVPAEVFDPATNTLVRVTGAIAGQESPQERTPNGMGTGVQLRDGRVFLVAFDSNATTSCGYIVDIATLVAQQLPRPRACWSAPLSAVLPSLALLHDGRVLIAGGKVDFYRHDISSAAAIFDPESDTLAPAAAMTRPRRFASMTTLVDGRVLVVG